MENISVDFQKKPEFSIKNFKSFVPCSVKKSVKMSFSVALVK
jgi:hypothetical protein